MGCLGNSKTEDQRIDEKAQREANKKIEKQLQKERQAYKATHRLLLLGKADLYCAGCLKCELTVIPFSPFAEHVTLAPFDSGCNNMSWGWILMEANTIKLAFLFKKNKTKTRWGFLAISHTSVFVSILSVVFLYIIYFFYFFFLSKVRESPEKAPL